MGDADANKGILSGYVKLGLYACLAAMQQGCVKAHTVHVIREHVVNGGNIAGGISRA